MDNGQSDSKRIVAAGILLLLATALLIVLHQDFWNWSKVDPRLFGFLPIGLTYHAVFAIACSVLMFSFVRLIWPRHLEDAKPENPSARSNDAMH